MATTHFPLERQCQSGTSPIGFHPVRLWFLIPILLTDTFCQKFCVPTVQKENRPPTRYQNFFEVNVKQSHRQT